MSWGHTLTPVPNAGDLFSRWLPCVAVCLTGLETSRKCRYFTSRSPGKPWSETSAKQNQNFLTKATQIRTSEEEREEYALNSCLDQEHLEVRYLAQGHLSSDLKGFRTSRIGALSYFLVHSWDFDVFCQCPWLMLALITMFSYCDRH